MNKKIISICFLTFVIGCTGGAVLAYDNHQKGLESQSLLASISQTQEQWEVEQFIRTQEEQRPEGLEESQIATGSRYTGITYNNVSAATVTSGNEPNLSSDTKVNFTANDANANIHTGKVMGRVSIQSGSLNIRSESCIGDNVIAQVYKDELLEIISQDDVWYQVVTANGLTGYVSSTYVEIVNE